MSEENIKSSPVPPIGDRVAKKEKAKSVAQGAVVLCIGAVVILVCLFVGLVVISVVWTVIWTILHAVLKAIFGLPY